jgi:tetratricopeptide (TPR) repeat protein
MSILQLKGSWPFVPEGTPNVFMTQFKPQSLEEQIAFDILAQGEGTLEQGHLKLAAEYQKNKQYVQAFQEYKALVYTVPTLNVFYEPMISLLMDMREYQLALRILQDALKFQESAFVYKWIGQIYLVLNETERGIRFLQEALEREPNDAQAVYNITRAFYKTGRFQQGDELLQKLQPKIGATREFQELVEYRELMLAEHQSKNDEQK